ncbi:uncharacterized protein E0L32_002976 [Thyridium curvatum]|uniref:Alpha/beta hydrolase fold-3 domain-containing protein n=1 Tax=Thyridium curvatum TaxID=1093900 RepID=A0A507B434_9PEZI|nr:uncharacterized protein E0L32_002976 [Thyridium curvatum]TPX17875.1 hypothetical protein E0L32_002976 [Thyridium curvatum]
MPLQYDPDYLKALEPLIPAISGRKPLTHDTITSSRRTREAGITALLSRLPNAPNVEQTYYNAIASDGHQVPILAFVKRGTSSTTAGPALLHFHGGGMIMGSAQQFARPLAYLVEETAVPIFSVDYRLAPEHTGKTLVNDCYASLLWLQQNAHEHNVDPARIAVYGESAGGGLAAGVALMARDRNLQPPLAKQILIYPMLDDRNMTPNEAVQPLAFWKTEDNVVGWTAVLGADKAGKPDAEVSPYVAPARAENLAGLPPTYLDVGGLDIFCNEVVAYAGRLLRENVETELHVYPGVPHAFEPIAPNISVTKRALANRQKAMQGF